MKIHPHHDRQRSYSRFITSAFVGILISGMGNPIEAAEDSVPSLTLYNQGFGVVREQIQLPLKKGMNKVAFSEVTAQLEPSSVILRDLSGKSSVRILEQNYRNDPVSSDLLLQYFTGKEIDFETTLSNGEKKIVRGKIIRAPYTQNNAMPMNGRFQTPASPIIEVDGKLQFTIPGTPLFPALADDSILHPTLEWSLESDKQVDASLELGYVTEGFSWEADYNLVFPEKGNQISMTGWITMQNQSGRTFYNAEIKLMAGDVQKIQRDFNAIRGNRAYGESMAKSMTLPPQVTEKTFDEYHLYSLARPTTLRDRETKQVEFLRSDKVDAKTIYIYNGSNIDRNTLRNWNPDSRRDDRNFGTQSNKKVAVYREFKNSKENGLGVPLPKGRVRFYRTDVNTLEFIGEGEIDHTPRDETLKIYTGDAFDLVGERKRMDFIMESSRATLTESFVITLRNRKSETVEIKVAETLYRGATWQIVEASDDWKKVDSQAIEFLVKVKPDEERVIKYTVRYTW